MKWTEVLDSLLEHPYDSPFLGELTRADRLRAGPMQLFLDGADYVFHIRSLYAFTFGPRSHEDDDGRKNTYGIYIGARIVRIKSVVHVGDSRELYKDVTTFEARSPCLMLRCASGRSCRRARKSQLVIILDHLNVATSLICFANTRDWCIKRIQTLLLSCRMQCVFNN